MNPVPDIPHLTISQVAARSDTERAEIAGLGRLDPAVEAAMTREVGRMRDRLAYSPAPPSNPPSLAGSASKS